MKTEHLVIALGVVTAMGDAEYKANKDSEAWNTLRTTVYRIHEAIEKKALEDVA